MRNIFNGAVAGLILSGIIILVFAICVIPLLIAIWCVINGIESINNPAAPLWANVLWFAYPLVWLLGASRTIVHVKEK